MLPGATVEFGDISYDFYSTEVAFADGTLTVTDSNPADTRSVGLAGSYAGVTFTAGGPTDSSFAQGVVVTVATSVACYCRGTLILTGAGERPVETLQAGDVLVTAAGARRPIRWIGRRSYGGRFMRVNPQIQPIRFSAGSLGGGMPRRDLLVSPDHAMLLDGFLVPARCLTNGTTITRQRRLDQVDYVHVELESHDVIFAEGAPSETFLDDDSRGMFHNAAEFATLYPGQAVSGTFCAPRLTDGVELETIRQRLVDDGVAHRAA